MQPVVEEASRKTFSRMDFRLQVCKESKRDDKAGPNPFRMLLASKLYLMISSWLLLLLNVLSDKNINRILSLRKSVFKLDYLN